MTYEVADFNSLENVKTQEEETSFCKKWVNAELHGIIASGMKSIILFVPFFYMFIFYRVPREFFYQHFVSTLICLPVVLVSYYGIQKKVVEPHWGWFLVELTYEILLAHIFYKVSLSNIDLSSFINVIFLFLGLAVYGIAMFPLPPWMGMITASSAITISTYSVWNSPQLPFIQTTIVMVLGISFAVAIRIFRYKNLEKEADLICQSLKIHRLNESLERENIERELLHAQKIQDSFLPPPQSLVQPGIKAQFFHEKHGLLGGDWMSARFLPNGNLIGLVADVTGKGVSASLVVHAVQSLWVHASWQEEFEPVAWMKKINKVLITMGHHSPHSLTMGFVSVMKNCLIYYSAAHIPLFVSRKRLDKKITALVGGGDLLGIKETINVKPIFYQWDPEDEVDIILASDGVFPRGSRTSKKEILDLEAKLENPKKNPPLDGILSRDDKMLLHIKCTEDLRIIN